MLSQSPNRTRWFKNLQYAQEWLVNINAFKISESGYLPNKTGAMQNFSVGTSAIFSSTIKYILLPGSLQATVVNYLIYN